jgi:hypothetical protein
VRALAEGEAVTRFGLGAVALTLTLGGVVACGPRGDKLAKMPNARPLPAATVHSLCTSAYGGDAAKLQVWRQRDGAFVVVELLPDVAKHGEDSPTTFFDDDGREVLRVRHVDAPSSPEALDNDRRREDVTQGGGKAEVIACKGK